MTIKPLSTLFARGIALAIAMMMMSGAAAGGEIDDLKRQVEMLQSRLAQVQAQLDKLAKAQAKAKPAATAKQPEARAVEVKAKPGIEIATKNKQFTAHVGGRLMADAAWYNEDKSALGNGTELRRVRIYISGTAFRDWAYKNQFDFAGNKVTVKDAYLKYKGFKPVTLTVGNFKEPFSLEELTSSKYITFMERALPNVFAGSRHLGVGISTHGENWTLAAGAYGDTVSADPGEEGDEGWDLAARGTVALGCSRACLHLGLGVRYRNPDDTSTVRFRERPESHIIDVRFVDTGTLGDVDNLFQLGSEAALIYGPLSVQGEYMRVWVNRKGALADLDFNGWYTQLSYFLTGESRSYAPAKGSFGRLKPKSPVGRGGLGAWEVGVRYSSLDLTDSSVLGGEAKNITLGLNWYLNSHIRFMWNAIWVNNDANATGNLANLHITETVAGDDDPFIFQMRAQVDY